jgi:CheY-like chemotaxis protein
MRVLYVDDDRVNALLFLELCRLAPGIEVQCVESGAEAQALVAEFQPELLVIDLHLPDTDGVQLLAQLRRTAGRRVPAVLCSADDTPAVIESARQAGFDGCWSKPLELQQVLQDLSRRAQPSGPGA